MGKKKDKKRARRDAAELAPRREESVAPRAPAPAALDALLPAVGGTQKIVDRLTAARLCYGKPVSAGNRTIVPVARVKAAGGGGFGRGIDAETAAPGSGGGGGGWLEADPVGYIDVGPDGSHFEAIHLVPLPRSRSQTALLPALLLLLGVLLRREALRRRPAARGPWRRR